MTLTNDSLDRFMAEFAHSKSHANQLHQIPFRVDVKHLERIEILRSQLGMPRNKLLNHLVAIALNEIDIRIKAEQK